MIIQIFKAPKDYSPPTLWAYMGYIYGRCARLLYYTNQDKIVQFTEQEMKAMQLGKAEHIKIQNYMKEKFPHMNFSSEVLGITQIPNIFGITQIGAKLDLYSDQNLAIEIKYMYSRKAYYQIAIEKFVWRQCQFQVFQYMNYENPDPFIQNHQTLINVKADLEMATVFVGRILTALNFKPPRFPKATKDHYICRSCYYRKKCYEESEVTWLDFKNASQWAIDRLHSSPPRQTFPPQITY